MVNFDRSDVSDISRSGRVFDWRVVLFAGLAVCAFGLSLLGETSLHRLLALSVAGSLLTLAVWLFLLPRWQPLWRTWFVTRVSALVANDPAPCLGSDTDGRIVYRNQAAWVRFSARPRRVESIFDGLFANPGPVIARMQMRAAQTGAAQEDVTTRRGHLRLTVLRIDDRGFLWRADDMSDFVAEGGGTLPRMILSPSGTVLGMNAALRRLVGDRLRDLDEIVPDLPLRPGEEHEIRALSGALRCFVAEGVTPGERREIYFLPVAGDKVLSHDAAGFEALPVALMRIETSGMVTAVNLAGRKLLGDVAPGSRVSDVLEGLGRPVSDWIAEALAGRAEGRPEMLRLRSKEQDRFLQVTLGKMVAEGRMGLIAVISDATQFKQLEAQFTQSQKMQAIGLLAGGVAHDFNNLLTAISGHCDLLMLRHDDADPDYADIDQIRQNTNRAAWLVRQLLAFSRKQTMHSEVIDLRDTLSDLTHLLNRLVGERVTLSLRHDADLKPIRADRRQLEQVVMNLVVNARDAMPEGGEIRIVTRNRHLPEDMLLARATVPAGDYVEVSVTDQGKGIAPDIMHKIFEPFYTTKRTGEGTGLGLSTAYGIVKQTGGYIFVDSELGQGSRFWILLPTYIGTLDPVAVPGIVPPVEAEPLAPTAATVLLVEDEAAVRAFASRALKLRGYTVLEAENGEEALKLLEDETLAIDIFISDVIMPGLDGPSWVSKALLKRPNTAVMFISGYAEDAFRDGQPNVPRSTFLAKPFSLNELTDTVRRALTA